jgi:hypothetical protein
MHIKRYLYLWHRWLGIGLCLFMALWFLSGIVMLYVGYPKLTAAEHLARLPALAESDCCIEPAAALAAAGRADAPLSLRLTSVAGLPRYLLRFADGTQVAVDGRSGRRIETVSAEQALASARQFDPSAQADYRGLVQEDRWTLSRALDADRPLHRVQLDDAQGRLLYISSQTGAVVRDASATERTWNWLGAWLHWLYPLRGPWWTELVIYLSLAATFMAVLGQVVGLLRWRFARPYRSGSRSPYAGFARWHHVAGLGFGAVLIAWMFSGLMSMNPWRLFESPDSLSAVPYRGDGLRTEHVDLPLAEALRRIRQAGLHAHELEWRQVGGEGYLTASDSAGDSRILAMRATAHAQSRLDRETLHAAARTMWPAGQSTAEWLHAYDAYYFARAEQSMYASQARPLPVLRVRFDDPAQTWIYLDPATGAMVHRLDEHRRAARWLFNLLHSWDWQPLLERPWLREGLVIVFSLGGMIVSVSGIVLGWRRLRRPAGRRVVRNA